MEVSLEDEWARVENESAEVHREDPALRPHCGVTGKIGNFWNKDKIK